MPHDFNKYFPYPSVRDEQQKAIDFALQTLIDEDKKYVVIEAGTGVGKSAIGLTVARYVDEALGKSEEFEQGSYFLTTQKVLQEQYEKDFGNPAGCMESIYSAKNYQCTYHKQNDCQTSQQLLRTSPEGRNKGSAFFKNCRGNCTYKKKKAKYLESRESVSNFQYFITESTYSGKITPRNVLVIDEAHNTEDVLSRFVEVSISQYFCEKIVKAKWPRNITPVAFFKWVRDDYQQKVQSQVLNFERQIEKMGLSSRLKDFQTLSMKYDMLKGHAEKLTAFIKDYSADNWVMEIEETERRGFKKVIYRAIDVSKFAEEYLFKMGKKVIFLSATILNPNAFTDALGLTSNSFNAISIPSPFPAENRPIFQASIGSMSAKAIEFSLPKLKEAVEAILTQHPDEKGMIHCHTYKIANYLKNHIKSNRIITHNSENRDAKLQEHIRSKKPTVLLSPSMTEGVDLKEDLSRFQIICKIPYPYLGDQVIRKRMNKYKGWYELQTAKTIVQSCGRSVRSKTDTAVTYILDSDWSRFYNRNSGIFPKDFKKALM